VGFWVRVAFGSTILAIFLRLVVRDARALRGEFDVPMSWTLAAVGGTVVAGFVHVALSLDHWRSLPAYAAFFIAAGLVQLWLASILARPAETLTLWRVAIGVNLALVAVYVQTRLAAPLGTNERQAVDTAGIVTVLAQLVAAAAGCLVIGPHRRSRSGGPPP